MLPSTLIELVALTIASLHLVDARKPFTKIDHNDIDDRSPLENREARRPFTLPPDFEANAHRKPFTAPPMITGRPVITNEDKVERPIIQEYVD